MWHKDLLSSALKQNLEFEFSGAKIDFDSRNIKKGDIFIALSGSNGDGEDYALDAHKKGASYVVVKDKQENIPENRQIIVDDTYNCLLELAKFKRAEFQGKIVAITGSVGKTTTKDICQFVFSKLAKTYSSYGNFNNHIGMPLCLANLDLLAEFAFFELGMNHLGEIRFLTKILRPDVAIITKITDAHIGNFSGIEGIIEAKSEIVEGLSQTGKLILNASDNNFKNLYEFIRSKYAINPKNILVVSASDSRPSLPDEIIMPIEYLGYEYLPDFCLKVIFKGQEQVKKQIIVPSFKSSLIMNFLLPFVLLESFGKRYDEILNETQSYYITKGRGYISYINYNNKKICLIDESYNSSPEAVRAMLSDLKAYCKLYSQKITFFMGDMLELGSMSQKLHLDLAKDILDAKISQFVAIGTEIYLLYKNLSKEDLSCSYYSKVTDLLPKLDEHINSEGIVVVKGSRGMKTDLVVKQLEGK